VITDLIVLLPALSKHVNSDVMYKQVFAAYKAGGFGISLKK
jgi:hypothetical protein